MVGVLAALISLCVTAVIAAGIAYVVIKKAVKDALREYDNERRL